MAGETPSPTISLRERSFPLAGAEERLPRWLVVSFLLHVVLIACVFVVPMLPSPAGPMHPVYIVDLIGGEKIGGTNLGTELTRAPKPASKAPEAEKPPVIPETKEIKKEAPEKVKQVEEFEKKKKELEDKSRIIDQLEKARTGPVMVLDYVSRSLEPLKLWIVRLGVKGSEIELEGRALTNDDVVEFVNNLRRTDYFSSIQLQESRQAPEARLIVYQFRLALRLKG